MQDFVQSGHIADLILAVLVIEAIAVCAFLRRTARGPITPFIGNAIAGGGLVLALRAALSNASWSWIAAALLVALAGHLVDLSWRLAPAKSRHAPEKGRRKKRG